MVLGHLFTFWVPRIPEVLPTFRPVVGIESNSCVTMFMVLSGFTLTYVSHPSVHIALLATCLSLCSLNTHHQPTTQFTIWCLAPHHSHLKKSASSCILLDRFGFLLGLPSLQPIVDCISSQVAPTLRQCTLSPQKRMRHFLSKLLFPVKLTP